MDIKKNYQPVAITGMGIISAVGEGIAAFTDSLRHGRSQFSKSQAFPSLSFPVLGAFISNFNLAASLTNYSALTKEVKEKIIKIARSLPYPVQLALIATLEAWNQARMQEYQNTERIGLVIGGQNTAAKYQYDLYSEFKQQPDYLTPSYALNFMDTNYVGVLSEVFGIRGEGFTVGGSSATGNVALIRAHQLIQDGKQDACLVVGAMADLSPMELQGFHNLGALGGHRFAATPSKACRPFDKDHEGFIYGQASAAMLLESIDSATKRKVPILGYILSGALQLDGNHLSNPQQEGELRVMQKALSSAGIKIEDINYINTHGTSAPLGDKTEIAAIEAFLGYLSGHVLINSTKSITGHCLWSAGVVEAIATTIQMQASFVHPNLNLDNPISNKSQFVMNKSKPLVIQNALSNSFGFGGINTTLVLSKGLTY